MNNQEPQRRRWPLLVCIALYTGLAIVEFGFTGIGSSHMAGPGSADQISQIWWISWAQFALAHGHNPFFTNWQNVPVGVNVLVNTSMLGLGVVISPITSAFGPIVAWNVLERAALVVSATSMCLVMRRWTNWWPAAFVAGLLYGFSAYETISVPHLFLAFVPLPPLFFLLLHEILVRQRWSANRAGVLLGVICAVQYLISSEILTSMVLLGAVAIVFFAIANRRRLTAMRDYAIHAALVALIVGGALLAGPVLYTLLGPGHLHGVPNSPAALARLHGDLLTTFVPGYFQRFSIHSLTAAYQLNGSSVYLGLPFMLAIILVTVLLRRRGIVRMAGALAAVSFLLSLGSSLYIAGHDTHVPLPFLPLAHIPLVQGLLSTRFALYTAMFGSALMAIGIDALRLRVAEIRVWRALSSRKRSAIAVMVSSAVVVAVTLPLLPLQAQTSSPSEVPAFFGSALAKHEIPAGSTVLTYPYSDNPVFPGTALDFSYSPRYQAVNDALLYQAGSGFGFKLIGGYGWRPVGAGDSISPSELAPASVKDLFDYAFYGVTTRPGQAQALTTSQLTARIATFLKKNDVESVVVLPVGHTPSTVTNALSAAIGAPRRSGGVTAWFNVQHRLKTVTPRAFRVTGPPPVTKLVSPVTGSHLHGGQYLVASASDAFGVRSVVFELSGLGPTPTDVCHGSLFQFGWICGWNSTSVPNGTYTLRSVATNNVGQVTRSAGVIVHVQN